MGIFARYQKFPFYFFCQAVWITVLGVWDQVQKYVFGHPGVLFSRGVASSPEISFSMLNNKWLKKGGTLVMDNALIISD